MNDKAFVSNKTYSIRIMMKKSGDSINSNHNILIEIMLELVRAGVFNKEPIIPQKETIDWDKLMDMASAHRIIPWVWEGICKLPDDQKPPRIQRINFALSAQAVWEQYRCQQQLLNKLIGICNRQGIRLLLLKGIGLSQLYPNPQSRVSEDIDIYLFEDHDKFNQLFTDSLIENHGQHHSVLCIDGITVENHFNFLDPDTIQRKKINDYIKSNLKDVVLTPYGYYQLNPIVYFVYIVMHVLRHTNHDAFVPVSQLLDLALYLIEYRHELSPKDCFKVLKKFRLEKGFEVLLHLSEHVVGLSFEEYHQYKLSSKYIAFLQSWIDGGLIKPDMGKTEELGVVSYCKQLKINRYVRQYMLKSSMIDTKKMRYGITNFMRALFHVPFEEPLRLFFKRKMEKK